jgi:hypothetical protein
MTAVGPPTWNYPAFHALSERLRGSGYEVINPAELHAPDPNLPHDWYLRRDLAQLVKCNRIVLLDGWQDSRGAKLEHHVGVQLGLQVVYPHEHGALFNV